MEKFTKENTVVLLIDHQKGTIESCQNRKHKVVVKSLRTLAKVSKALGLPVLITSSQEDQQQGPILEDLQELLPEEYNARVKRAGIINAWDEPEIKKQIQVYEETRKNIIIAGITHDVCVVWPSIAMQEDGYQVQVVVDAGGSPSQLAEDIAVSTWRDNGVRSTTISQLIAELISDWSSSDGQKALKILQEEMM